MWFHLTDMWLHLEQLPCFTHNTKLSITWASLFPPAQHIQSRMFNVTSHLLTSHFCYLKLWHCCSYPGKALAIQPRWRATDSRWPIIIVGRPHCARRASTPVFCWTLFTTIHLWGYGCRLPSSHRPLSTPTTWVHWPSFSTDHPPLPPAIGRTADDSYVPQLGVLLPFCNYNYFLGSTPIDMDDLAFWVQKDTQWPTWSMFDKLLHLPQS